MTETTRCGSRINQNYTRKTQHDGFWLGERSVGGKIDASRHQLGLRYAPTDAASAIATAAAAAAASPPGDNAPSVGYIFLVAELE